MQNLLTGGDKIVVSVHDFYQISPKYHRTYKAALKSYKKLKKEGYNPEATLIDKDGNGYANVDFQNIRLN
jgi:hypothetical protein